MHFLIFIILHVSSAFAQKSVEIDEQYLKKLIEKEPPSIQQIEASFLSTKQTYLTNKDKFGLRLDGEGQVYDSNEIPINPTQDFITTSSVDYSIGIVKPTRYGVDVGVKAFGNKISNTFFQGASVSGVGLSLSVDLFQNFLGRQSNNTLKQGELSLQRADLERKSSVKTFESNIRKLYWALVANNEQKKLLSSLVNTAEKQYWETMKRKKSGVADSGEAARFRSQWTSRKANLLALNYQEGEILKNLKQLLPSLNGKKISITKYDVEKTVNEVLTCTAKIDSFIKAPFQHTVYDEIVGLLEKEERLQQKVISRTAGPQIKLFGEYSSVGRGIGFEGSQEILQDNPKPRTSLGLQFSMPLGKSKKKVKEVSELLTKKRYTAEARANLSKIKAFHSETVYLIKTLREVVKNQKDTNKYIDQSLKVSRRKYRQARIGIQELISEQDSLLQSKLNVIDSNLTIINTLIDYFSIYMDVPCSFNQI